MDTTEWIASASSRHFTYRTQAKRPWKPETVLQLLEQAHQEFEKLMGAGLDIIIEVEDRICEPKKYGAWSEVHKQIHSPQDYSIEVKIICEFPLNYGYTQQEHDLAYHFFVHEHFHNWIGGSGSTSHGMVVEAITQYMTDRTLVRLGWCTEDMLIRGRIDRQRTIDDGRLPHTTIARYQLLFDQIDTSDPDKLLAFCRDLADCFRQQRNRRRTEVFPVLRRYLGTKLEEIGE